MTSVSRGWGLPRIAMIGVATFLGCSSSKPTEPVVTDTTPPTIAQATPADASDLVALNTTIQIKMSEPVIIGSGGGLRLIRQGVAVTGSTTISADSLTLTFTPAGALSPNAIYRAGFASVADKAGNAVAATTSACFVTTNVGATRTATFTDPSNDVYQGGTPPTNLMVPDLIAVRFARDVNLFSTIIQFSGPRTFSSTASSQAGVAIDIDTDQDSTTGFTTLKDTLFGVDPPTLPDIHNSGMRAEYGIDLEPDPNHGDSATVIQYTEPLGGQGFFIMPDACGAFLGFVIPWTALGNDDGNMNVVLLGIVGTTTGLYVDPMPSAGHLTLSLPLVAPPFAAAAPQYIPWRPILRPRTLRPLRPLR